MFIDNLLLKIADLYYNHKLKKGSITPDEFKEKDIVFRQNTYNILVTILSLGLGYLFGIFLYTLVFYIAFNVLRIFSNGYHSYGNVTYCALAWWITSTPIIFLAINTQSVFYHYFILNIISYFYLYEKTPYVNNKAEAEELSKSRLNYKFGVTITYVLYLIISFILSRVNMVEFANVILLSNLYVVLFMNNYVAKVMSKVRYLMFKN